MIMAQITSGRVVFSKTIQDHQFEPKRAEIELSFTIEEGEDIGDAIRSAGKQARDGALTLVRADSASSKPAKGERPRRFRGRTDLDD